MSVNGNNDLPTVIRSFRRRAGLTQEQLGRQSGLSVRTIRMLESGMTRMPRLATASLLSDALDLTPEEKNLLTGAQANESEETPEGDGLKGHAAWPGAQLPPVASPLIGREIEAGYVTGLTRQDTAPPIVLSGQPGAGKTCFVVHWTHANRNLFPDGQVYLSVRDIGPGFTCAEETQALSSVLISLGISHDLLPDSPHALTGFYRGVLADRKMLLILDDVQTEEQVAPLLPGPGLASVVIVSRRLLHRLTAAHGARHITLGNLTEQDGCAMLLSRLGGTGESYVPDAAIASIVRLCENFPLAIALVGAWISTHDSSLSEQLIYRFAKTEFLSDDAFLSMILKPLAIRFRASFARLGGCAQSILKQMNEGNVDEFGLSHLAPRSHNEAANFIFSLEEAATAHWIKMSSPGTYNFGSMVRAAMRQWGQEP